MTQGTSKTETRAYERSTKEIVDFALCKGNKLNEDGMEGEL